MLTKRQNMLETIRGGNPDRFVNQFEALAFSMGNPFMKDNMKSRGIGSEWVNAWGVTIRFQENTPGPFPVHDDAHKVLKDITKWREVVKAPNVDYPEEAWAPFIEQTEKIDRTEQFVTPTVAPGVFEQLHYLMGMDDCMINFYLEPECIKELIEYITEWELKYAAVLCKYIKPDAIIHHDDWGSQRSTFLSPEMFEEFLLPAYKRIYGYYKSHGVELIIHHSDSYAATLVPFMIDMGIDVWQGCLNTNNVPELIKKYGGKISFMGGINNGVVDVPNWNEEMIASFVEQTCRDCGKLYFIPSCTAGGPGTSFKGVYETVTREINRMSGLMFG
ncbi:MAG: uroporphyrinogen decarboxylase [Clostridiales bacterium]|nr:uroporphyrinogen decarboxylase [Clostridiales bacterium]